MRHSISLTLFLCSILFLGGCAKTNPPSSSKAEMGNLLLAEPAPINPRSQMAIARYNQILASEAINDEDKAELYYQRGMLYDSVGLAGLAQFDYSQALVLKPDMAEAYNSIGIHYIQQMDFIQAYEAFDSTLDINPNYDFAFLNRGIALYYGGRSDLAIDDLNRFLAIDESDPFRALWTYFAAAEVDAEAGKVKLKKMREKLEPLHWASKLVDLFLGELTEQQVLAALLDGISSQKELTDRLCEAYFYLGKFHTQQGNRGIAANYFKLALSTNVFDYVEHRYARLELVRLRNPDNLAE
ncbi:lipoprotein NlpI [Alteromonas ponticola]|uniref:Lipoprotein NlpI n=1 Tax=Alteromonas aquimaris TaxID=2998417 RepID=A0ABT3P781_9ALTE|nr:lipoprotein NlpI [Alteromonas aquimaris]MCW8108589.1 lipoprotein NlpI [Alteromonas aquimaris]